MALAVYLKAFCQKLTTQAESQVKKLHHMQITQDHQQFAATLEQSTAGFETLKRAIGQYVQCCLSNTCEQRYKS